MQQSPSLLSHIEQLWIFQEDILIHTFGFCFCVSAIMAKEQVRSNRSVVDRIIVSEVSIRVTLVSKDKTGEPKICLLNSLGEGDD